MRENFRNLNLSDTNVCVFCRLCTNWSLMAVRICWIFTRRTHNHNYLNYRMHRAVGACKHSQCCLLVQMMFTVPEKVPARCYLSHELLLLRLLSYKPITREKSYFTVQRKKDVYFQTADFFYGCCSHNMNILFCIAEKKKHFLALKPISTSLQKKKKKKYYEQDIMNCKKNKTN